MDMGHLYNDAHFNDPIIELDVKEQMKTKEVNAREERNFERQSKSYERAKNICERNTTWERWKVGQTLRTIWERTPRLEQSLAVEKARVESLQRALLTRQYRQNFGQSSPSLPQIVYPQSPQAQSSERLQRGKSYRLKRGRGKQKRDKRERPLNTDFTLNRHLHRDADFIRRSEHVVKALARLNWRQESRRRDHEKFREELIEISKPVIDRAKMVLKGRPDMDVDQFVEEFENFIFQDDSKKISGSMNSLISKNGQSLEDGNRPQRLTKGNLLSLESGESQRFLPSVAATSSTDLTVVDNGHCSGIDNDNNKDGHKDENGNDIIAPPAVTENKEESNAIESKETKDETEDATDVNNLNVTDNANASDTTALLSRRHTGHEVPKHKDDDEFHLPSINDFRSGTERPRIKRATGSLNSSTSSLLSSASSPHITSNSKSSSVNNDVFSPSTSVSQVIIEEDEVLSTAPSYHHQHHYNFHAEPPRRDSLFDDDDDDDDKETKTYALSCTIGLPQLWRQPQKQQKEKASPEISASTIARKHRRKRNSQRII